VPSCLLPIVTGVEMRRRVVGAAEIGRMLGGLSRQRVSQLTSAKDFPKPLDTLAMGNIWLYEDVAAWAKRAGRELTPLPEREHD
jgi:prophage regulatory protein